jgi:hypothetical protein
MTQLLRSIPVWLRRLLDNSALSSGREPYRGWWAQCLRATERAGCGCGSHKFYVLAACDRTVVLTCSGCRKQISFTWSGTREAWKAARERKAPA